MRELILTFIAVLFVLMANGQEDYSKKLFTLGAGYLGETLTHPGIVLQSEFQQPIATRWSVPLRAEAGYYFHKRNHQATLLQASTGVRFHATSRFYAGVHGGIGGMLSWHHSDQGVFEVDDNGNISKASNFAGLDFLLNSGFEFGYKLSKEKDNYLWLRPEFMWQRNVNERALGHIALKIGYSFTL